MTIQEKLKRLTRLSNKSAVAKDAGISPVTFCEIMHGKSGMRFSTVKALARSLGVSVGWLADDGQGWPPVRIDSDASIQPPVAV